MKELKDVGIYVLNGDRVVEITEGHVCAFPDHLSSEKMANINQLKAKYPELHAEHTKDKTLARFEKKQTRKAERRAKLVAEGKPVDPEVPPEVLAARLQKQLDRRAKRADKKPK